MKMTSLFDGMTNIKKTWRYSTSGRDRCSITQKPGIRERVHFKILLMTFKCLNQIAPSYLSDLSIHYRPSRTLRSSDKELLVQPHCHLQTYGERAFSFIAPKLWNTLPLSIKRCNSAKSFKSTLKTYLFRNYFEL